jgi:NAD+ kinase
MSERHEVLESEPAPRAMPSRLGLVVHPSRAIERPLGELRRWADGHGVDLVQVQVVSRQQQVAEVGDPEDCDLLVSIGGDGTTLAAMRAGAIAAKPVLAVACGSLGVLTSVPAGEVVQAVERFGRGDWVPWRLPGLDVAGELGTRLLALNDLAVVRADMGQIRLTAELDGQLFARLAGDGCIVSTPIGSSAYTNAAGGPLLMPELDAFVITALPTHGGSRPPLVMSADSSLRVQAAPGHGGARLELDGQRAGMLDDALTITFRKAVATIVNFPGQEPMLAVLRGRGIIIDSPRILLDDARHPL